MDQRGLNTKRPTIVLFRSHETSPVIWIALNGDTVLVKGREMTGRTQTTIARRAGAGVSTLYLRVLSKLQRFLNLRYWSSGGET